MTELGINPFTNLLQIRVRELEFKNQYKTDEDGDLLPVVKEVEDSVFFKVYCTAEKRKIFSNLSPISTKILFYILHKLKINEDFINIDKEKCLEELSIALNTYKKGIEQLIRYGFISPTIKKNVYWINPDFYFKGDRIKMFPKNLEIRK